MTFGRGPRAVHAVNGVSYDIAAGETLAIVGESGSGKTVSALAILGLLPRPAARIHPASQVMFEGRDLLKMSIDEMRSVRGKQIAMIFQDPMTSLNPVLSVRRQLTEVLETHLNLGRRAAAERSVELLAMVGIPNPRRRISDYPHQFSGGMRQRVMIAMAIACEPKLLIADEPTTALDVTIQAQILDLIRHSIEQLDTALILITHDLGVVAGTCNRVLVMYAGHVVEEADTGEMFGRPRHPYSVGLLLSIPRLDEERPVALVPIDGQPPDLSRVIEGCPFAPRCFNAEERCFREVPELTQAPKTRAGHRVASFYPADGERLVPSGRE